MRISERIVVALSVGFALVGTPAFAFDGTTVGQDSALPMASAAPPVGAAGALRKAAPSNNSLSALQYAAEDGHPIAQWKLGRMYA